MALPKNVVINFLGGAWAGALIVLSTPVFLARLGLEGFGLIGFWQLLIYLSMVADLGLGSACARELARSDGSLGGATQRRALFRLFERPVLVMAGTIALLLISTAGLIANGWLNFSSYRTEQLTSAVRWIGVSVAGQFLAGFYANGLAGLQLMGSMNALQALNNGLRFLGGALLTALTGDIEVFFAFQAVTAVASAALSRVALTRALGPASGGHVDVGPLRQFMLFSSGMFFTAICGALISNADRLAVSKLLEGEALGRYSVALTTVGLLQMVVFAFHRTYFPRFSQLSAGGNEALLKSTYLTACTLLGTLLVPAGLVFLAFTQEVFSIWLGRSDPATVTVSRALVCGFVLSGLIWLPAAYQQAAGRTRTHATLMAVTLLIGIPAMIWSIRCWGLIGATSLALLHGFVQITLAQWIMNRGVFPGRMFLWYERVVLRPALVAGSASLLSVLLLPSNLSQPLLVLWIGATYLAPIAVLLIWMRRAPIVGTA